MFQNDIQIIKYNILVRRDATVCVETLMVQKLINVSQIEIEIVGWPLTYFCDL